MLALSGNLLSNATSTKSTRSNGKRHGLSAMTIRQGSVSEIIRIYHECEGKIEKSVPRIAVLHHEACRMMTNGDPDGPIFLSYPHTNNGFFFLAFHCFFFYLFNN